MKKKSVAIEQNGRKQCFEPWQTKEKGVAKNYSTIIKGCRYARQPFIILDDKFYCRITLAVLVLPAEIACIKITPFGRFSVVNTILRCPS